MSSTPESLYERKAHDQEVSFEGRVVRLLADDNEGSRHQRFVVRLESGLTILVAHNLDLVARVPLHEGDPVEVRGVYEWSEEGGTVHWTHRDPQGHHADGYVLFKGRRFQ